MEKLRSVGSVLLTLGIASFLLSLVNLEFRVLGFLGEYKVYVEIGSVVIGLILIGVSKLMGKNENEEQN